MRITILAPGSRGDIQPYVALGKGLKSAGFEVNLATHAYFEHFVRSQGFDFSLISGNPREIINSSAGQNWLESCYRPLTFMRRLRKTLAPLLFQIFDDTLNACRGSQAVMFGVISAFPALTAAEKLGIQPIPATKQHLHPTRAYPCGMVMPAISFGPLFNRLTYPIGHQIYWQFLRTWVNGWRKQIGLPAESLQGPIRKALKSRLPCLHGFSEHVIPHAPEWGQEVEITGYWMLEEEADWNPPPDLQRFLDDGPAPVYIGFGSMAARSAERTAKISVAALNAVGLRGVLLRGWGGMHLSRAARNVHLLDFAPHDWLFPRMKAVVHHGGSGTTAIGLKCGKPSVLVPFFADQPYWGWHVKRLKVGPKPLPITQLNTQRLASALDEAVGNPQIAARAAALGEKLQQEDGVANAVQAMLRIMGFSG